MDGWKHLVQRAQDKVMSGGSKAAIKQQQAHSCGKSSAPTNKNRAASIEHRASNVEHH